MFKILSDDFQKEIMRYHRNVRKEEETMTKQKTNLQRDYSEEKKKNLQKKINGTPQASIKDRINFSWFIFSNYEDGRTKK